MTETLILSAVALFNGIAFLTIKARVDKLTVRLEDVRATQLSEAESASARFEFVQGGSFRVTDGGAA